MERTIITRQKILDAYSENGGNGILQLYKARGKKGLILNDSFAVNCWELFQDSSLDAVINYIQTEYMQENR